MAALETLIKLREWTLEQIQRQLQSLEGDLAALTDRRRALEQALIRQRALARKEPLSYGKTYAGFFRRHEEKRQEILRQEADLAAQIEEIRRKLQEVFGDKKALEQVLDRHKLTAQILQARRAQNHMDDWVAAAFIRRHLKPPS